MTDRRAKQPPFTDETAIQEGGWQKPVAPPTARVKPTGLPPKPTPDAKDKA